MFLGSLLGDTSPVATSTPLLGAEILLEPGSTLVLDVDPAFEHGVLVDAGSCRWATSRPSRTSSPTCRPARRITLEPYNDVRVLLLGGPPFGEEIVMWWNFVGRSHEEVVGFREDGRTRSPTGGCRRAVRRTGR